MVHHGCLNLENDGKLIICIAFIDLLLSLPEVVMFAKNPNAMCHDWYCHLTDINSTIFEVLGWAGLIKNQSKPTFRIYNQHKLFHLSIHPSRSKSFPFFLNSVITACTKEKCSIHQLDIFLAFLKTILNKEKSRHSEKRFQSPKINTISLF